MDEEIDYFLREIVTPVIIGKWDVGIGVVISGDLWLRHGGRDVAYFNTYISRFCFVVVVDIC